MDSNHHILANAAT